ncbi:TetR/AcrR family transcriptional regulator [Kineosporia sp. J2-2]|uniref:TetR/AcrR family transcriptional regulator n=1 Tax=Kineosporia corallincola TaxID=2835133 RepID=A0ABS5TCW2_9ACTN|nr:TetR/AcrR family transcriptional regulator [Kineosporia corallincola]MBT0768683.1 TetR/AcrR family transcriptional regulator [Kineosporia corallincola]
MPTGRNQRADATRNRELLLAAAEEEFTEKGLDASVADIARRAGVAKGTIFRHFATKEDLIAAIVSGHFAALIAIAERLLTASDPGAALLQLLTETADNIRQNDLLFLQSITGNDSRVLALRDELHATITALVTKAQEAKAIRPDLTGTDVFALMCTPVHAVDFLPNPSPDSWKRYLAIIFDGFRPEGATALPVAAPDWG